MILRVSTNFPFLQEDPLPNKDPKAPTFSSVDWSTPPNTSSHSVHLAITRENDLDTHKESIDKYVNKGEDKIIKPLSTTSPAPSLGKS